MLLFSVQTKSHSFLNPMDDAVDSNPDEPGSLNFFQNAPVLSFFPANDRTQNNNFAAFWKLENLPDNLIYALARNNFCAFRAMGNPDSAEQKTEIIVNLRNRSYGGPWVVAASFFVIE